MGDNCVSEPCKGDKTYDEAERICSSKGLRLCSVSEINTCCNTGCGYDHHTVWIGDQKPGAF